MKFKEGDKVKIITVDLGSNMKGKIGFVIKVYPPDTGGKYRVKVGAWECPMYERELEPLIKIGEQLLLFEL